MSIALPPLPFPHNALEPFISRATIEFHHGHHEAAYVRRTNELIDGSPYDQLSPAELVRTAYENGEPRLLVD